MGSVAIIKKPNILRGEIVSILQENLPAYKVKAYNADHYKLFFKEGHNLPDILIIDLEMNIDISTLINFYLERDTKIVVLVSKIDEDYLMELFKLGLHGYLFGEMETSELTFAIKSIVGGGRYVHPRLAHIFLNDYIRIVSETPKRPPRVLTKREWEVLELIVEGNKNCSIGEQLLISSLTVKNHVTSILRKLHVTDRTSAALLAVKQNWISL